MSKQKLISQIAVHLSDEDARLIKGLAAREGREASVYAREVLISHLKSIRVEYESMRALFECEGSESFNSTEQTDGQ